MESVDEMPKKKKKKPASKEYMQEYYIKHKGAYVCEHCEKVYTCKSSLGKHQKNSIKCYMEKVKTVLEEIRHMPVENSDTELVLSKMEAVIQIK